MTEQYECCSTVPRTFVQDYSCANLRAVAWMSITGWKQGCNMAVTGYLQRNFELNVTGLFQDCYSVESSVANCANDEL